MARGTVRAHTRQTRNGPVRVRQHNRSVAESALDAWDAYRATRLRANSKTAKVARTGVWSIRHAARAVGRRRYGTAVTLAAWGAAEVGGWALGRGVGAAATAVVALTVTAIVLTDKHGPIRGTGTAPAPKPTPAARPPRTRKTSRVYDEADLADERDEDLAAIHRYTKPNGKE